MTLGLIIFFIAIGLVFLLVEILGDTGCGAWHYWPWVYQFWVLPGVQRDMAIHTGNVVLFSVGL